MNLRPQDVRINDTGKVSGRVVAFSGLGCLKNMQVAIMMPICPFLNSNPQRFPQSYPQFLLKRSRTLLDLARVGGISYPLFTTFLTDVGKLTQFSGQIKRSMMEIMNLFGALALVRALSANPSVKPSGRRLPGWFSPFSSGAETA